jgi:hypothetical protein
MGCYGRPSKSFEWSPKAVANRGPLFSYLGNKAGVAFYPLSWAFTDLGKGMFDHTLCIGPWVIYWDNR